MVGSDGVCVRCAERSEGLPYWDGAECVSECPYVADSENICRTCEEYNSTEPYWDAQSKSCLMRCIESSLLAFKF